MSNAFHVNPEVRAEFQLLSVTADARPFNVVFGISTDVGTVYWSDEWPGSSSAGSSSSLPAYLSQLEVRSRNSLTVLFLVREQAWRNNGFVPEEFGDFWTAAREAIPSWPGFTRLHLTENQRAAVEASRLFAADVAAAFDELVDEGTPSAKARRPTLMIEVRQGVARVFLGRRWLAWAPVAGGVVLAAFFAFLPYDPPLSGVQRLREAVSGLVTGLIGLLLFGLGVICFTAIQILFDRVLAGPAERLLSRGRSIASAVTRAAVVTLGLVVLVGAALWLAGQPLFWIIVGGIVCAVLLLGFLSLVLA